MTTKVARIDAKVKNIGLPYGGLGLFVTVTDEDGNPLADQEVCFEIAGNPIIHARTDTKGKAVMKLTTSENLRLKP